jgi:HEAT repeat protein
MRRLLPIVVLPLLGAVLHAQSAGELATELKSKERADRIRAANELGKLGPGAAAAVGALAQALADEVPEVRNAAADALGKIGKAAVATVGKALADRDRKVAAARAVAGLGPHAASLTPAVVDLLRVGTLEANEAVRRALPAIGEPAMPHLLKALDDNAINMQLCEAMVPMGPTAKPAVETLLKLLAKRGVRAPEGAAQLLGAIGDPRAVPALAAAVERGLPKVDSLGDATAEKAMGSLGQLKLEPKRVVPLCVRVLENPRRDMGAMQTKRRALEALERFDAREPAVLAALRGFLAADPGEHKVSAERLLTKLGG